MDLKPLPFALDALEPHMSKETLEYHWGKHHRSYVNNLNKQIEGTELNKMTLESIILTSYNKDKEEEKKLVVVNSPNAINPLVLDYHPLLTIDVWEHAYYLDFQNRRPDYVSVFLDKLVSWEAVSLRLEAAKILMIGKKKGVESN
ncbi:superoxide dismutase [Fe], chloroplastic [Lactuca sativa]|uniref:superoxide dismutase [Fe], chloroplastic n=1 Tax=Lactuca sativa TaxID=4236 RepID=UPI001C68C4D1|nr:superoxide dismutase [Fe], chloroplastic [Lactuca sativa]XP_042753217.1 superoxide dismutase [Fe], chloroplastic [Lactuca sativa]